MPELRHLPNAMDQLGRKRLAQLGRKLLAQLGRKPWTSIVRKLTISLLYLLSSAPRRACPDR